MEPSFSPSLPPSASRLYTPQDSLDTLIKVRASLEPTSTVIWWEGAVYSLVPDKADQSQKLFTFSGINVARAVETADGYQLLSREAAFYCDPTTGKPLATWNPVSVGGPNKQIPVVHVWNDPVNSEFLRNGPRGPFEVPTQDLGNGMVCLSMDIFLAYPSPISRDEFPVNSASNLYQGAELFQFIANKEHLADPLLASAPTSVSWTRIGQWLPWMEMGNRPGGLVYQCRGAKTADGFEGVNPEVLLAIRDEHPQFLEPPAAISGPNETSWTYFKKHHLSQQPQKH